MTTQTKNQPFTTEQCQNELRILLNDIARARSIWFESNGDVNNYPSDVVPWIVTADAEAYMDIIDDWSRNSSLEPINVTNAVAMLHSKTNYRGDGLSDGSREMIMQIRMGKHRHPDILADRFAAFKDIKLAQHVKKFIQDTKGVISGIMDKIEMDFNSSNIHDELKLMQMTQQ